MDVPTLVLALKKSKKYTDDAIAAISKGMNYKGSVATVADLPLTGNTKGDVYTVSANHAGYVWSINASSGTVDDWELFWTSSEGLVLQAADTEQVDGFDCPVLSIEQVTAAYNALVAGGTVTVQSEDGDLQFKAQMGDAATGRPSVLIPYYWLGWIDYQIAVSEVDVVITVHKVPEAPTHQITSVNVGTNTIDITIS